MKKLIMFIIIVPFLFSSCNDELDRDWLDPQVYQPAPDEVVSGLFTHMQKTRFWMKDYGEWYWFLAAGYWGWLGSTQLGEFPPYSQQYISYWADERYGDLDAWVDPANNNTYQRFTRFYTELNNYSLIRDEVDVLSGTAYDDAVIYVKLATILKNVVALQTVDLFNSIPYFDAFKGSQGVFFAEYDDPMEIYKSVIEEYQTIAGELPGIKSKMSAIAKSTLETQDIFFKGDVDKWVQYINAQTLKSCVRLSGVNADFVKPFLAEAIKKLPNEDFTFGSPQVNENRIGISSGGIWQRGLYEQFYNLGIPDVIMCRMNHGSDLYDPTEDDPRLPAIALGFSEDLDPDNVEYYGVSGNWERNRHLRYGLTYEEGRRANVYPQNYTTTATNMLRPNQTMDRMVQNCPWSYYNPVTFVLSESPLVIFTRGEVDLLLAEVALKNLASTGKSAGEHIKDAVIHSTDFWYMMNTAPNYIDAAGMSDAAKQILQRPKPDAGIISNYASKIQNNFNAAAGLEDKMEILMQQKYIHLNFFDGFENFAELRRTRHPKLEPITCTGSSNTLVNATMMWERFKLPNEERANNYEYYSKVMADDHWGKPIFWVPQEKINEKYFLPEAIKAPLP